MEQNYSDPRLKSWSVTRTTKKIDTQHRDTTYIEGYPNNVVYCYGQNITLFGRTVKCPFYLIGINSNVSFSTPDGVIYKISENTIKKTERLMELPSDIDIHFDTDNQLVNEELNMIKLKEVSEAYVKLNDSSVAFKLGDNSVTWYQTATTSTVISVALLMTLLFFMIYFGLRHSQTQVQILSTVYDQADGSGSYATLHLNKRETLKNKAAQILPKKAKLILAKSS